MNIFVGIDPSINSTGICIRLFDNEGNNVKDKFYIIKGGKLNKKEKKAESENLDIFQYVLYDKIETSESENNHEFEMIKTNNFIKIVDEAYNIINNEYRKYDTPEDPIYNIWVCQEGISYGSTLRTKSIFDLAGLNYMLRMRFIRANNDINYIIATPGEVKKYATGAGNANKDLMECVFRAHYPNLNLPKIDDIADAFFMSSYAKYIYDNKS